MIATIAPLGMPWWAYVLLLTVTLVVAVLRMTRFITQDTLFDWTVYTPLFRWASRKEWARRRAFKEVIRDHARDPELTEGAQQYLQEQADRLEDDEPLSWQARLVSGLECPHCVSFHVSWIMIVLTLVCATVPVLAIIWHVLILALAISYIAAHLSAHLDTPPAHHAGQEETEQ